MCPGPRSCYQLPDLVDTFIPPPGGRYGKNTPKNTALYLKQCLPTVEQIPRKIKDSKLDWETSPASQDHKLQRIPKTLRRFFFLRGANLFWRQCEKSSSSMKDSDPPPPYHSGDQRETENVVSAFGTNPWRRQKN